MAEAAPITPADPSPAAPPRRNLPTATILLFAAAGLGACAFAGAVLVAQLHQPKPAPPANVVTAPITIPPAAAVAPPPPVVEPAPAEIKPATLPPLPETALSRMPVHTIPDPPGPDRNVSPEVANGPMQPAKPAPAAPKQFAGSVHVTGPTALVVGTVPVQLFGIKAPTQDDRCGLGGSDICVAVAQRTLTSRLTAGDQISCHVPTPKPGIVVAFAICLDAQGTDIAGTLVSNGLALADAGQSADYLGAESIARAQKRGLWAFRQVPVR